jgi:hypothetical protein
MTPVSRTSIGLLTHFACWWVISSWFWTHGWGWNMWSWMTPVAPLYLGIFYLQPHHDWHWGAAGIVVSLLLITGVVFAMHRQRRWTILLAHFAVLLYWLVGFFLISTGV